MRKWFKELRTERRLTQKALADKVNVSVTTINKIELGLRRPSPSTAKSIANVLGFDWTCFYENNDEKDCNR